MQTVLDIIKRHTLTMLVQRTDKNPAMDQANMDHWKCTIIAGSGKRMALVFSMGSGHNGKPPTLDMVLDCLASDAATIDSARSFADWCSELGYDEDSRKAERTYKACKRQAAQLEKLLGGTHALHDLMFNTERL